MQWSHTVSKSRQATGQDHGSSHHDLVIQSHGGGLWGNSCLPCLAMFLPGYMPPEHLGTWPLMLLAPLLLETQPHLYQADRSASGERTTSTSSAVEERLAC
jgi:hypothetical protein